MALLITECQSPLNRLVSLDSGLLVLELRVADKATDPSESDDQIGGLSKNFATTKLDGNGHHIVIVLST